MSGWICVAAGDAGIAACTLPQPTPEQAVSHVRRDLAAPAHADALLPRVVKGLHRYFGGEQVPLDFPLDLSRLPHFTRRVLLAVAEIPYGETRSYGWVARQIGRAQAARAVGQAMARNPLAPIVPCHRVIGRDGSLVGFGSGLDCKRSLLALEGARAAEAEP
ncbi:MAG: methylated-DNA--[protein]-cysteine S-methyltransferase [Armatimonadota bacterium]|nr:MAG: methylated-DNA--[protein]-cysteine S-methyltransferase [Armatimonadota bacterium]